MTLADKVQLSILKEGVIVWNTWRQDNPEIGIDLSEADLIGANLSEADLSLANLGGAGLLLELLSF